MSIKKQTEIDQLPAGTTAGDFAPEPTGPDDTVSIETPDDIRGIGYEDPPRELLGDWLSKQTSKNTYKPSAGVTLSTPMQGNIDKPTIQTGGPADTSSKAFFDDILSDASAYFENIGGGGTPDTRGGGTFTPTQLADMLEKVNPQNATEDQETGNTLLSSIQGDVFLTARNTGDYGNSDATKVQKEINSVLKYNRFSPGGSSPYIQDRQYSSGIWSNQTRYGEFDEDAKAPSLEELAKVGLSLMLRATGDKSDPDSQGSSGAMVAGILPQLAMKKIDTVDLETSDVAESVMGQRLENSSYNFIDQKGILRRGSSTDPLDAENQKSFGQLNSYLEPWGGPLPISMILLSVLAALATIVAGVIIGLFLDLIILLFPNSDRQMPGDVYPMGAASGTPEFGVNSIGIAVKKFLGMPYLKSGYPFWKCMSLGAIQFFYSLPGADAGYFLVVSRSAIRDVEQIADAFKNMPSITDPIGFVEGLFMILEAFATSATFRFLITMSRIGDIVYFTGGWGGSGPLLMSPYVDGKSPDLLPATIENAHMKSRTLVAGQDDDSTSLAWRFGATPSMYLLPKAFDTYVTRKNWAGLNLTKAFTAEFDKADNPDGYDKIQRLNNGQYRIPQEEVQRIENILDVSYMPFYFHDVRTNEIVSFHAFLETITDSFQPKWKEEEGFGRMDPVQIYQNTTRKLGVNFYVAATNPDDFDEMWYAINRLVAMVYPQWSMGQQRKDAEGNTFIQPFSQVPTASPLLRLRIGELFKSNYSDLNLQRLFGIVTDAFGLVVDSSDMSQEIQEKLEQAKDNARLMLDRAEGPAGCDGVPYDEILTVLTMINLGVPPTPSVGYTPGMIAAFTQKENLVNVKPGAIPGTWEKTKKKVSVDGTVGIGLAVKIIGYDVNPLITINTPPDDIDKQTKRQKKNRKVNYVVEFMSVFNEDGSPLTAIVNHQALSTRVTDIRQLYINAFVAEIFAAGGAAVPPSGVPALPDSGREEIGNDAEWYYAEEVRQFFDQANNAVVKAFKSAGGDGIAGVINSLDFDYNITKVPWETVAGSRAPKVVKISVGFSPIHDIPLGLSHDGSMRAVSHPVGGAVRGLYGAPNRAYGDESYFAALDMATRFMTQPLEPPEPPALE